MQLKWVFSLTILSLFLSSCLSFNGYSKYYSPNNNLTDLEYISFLDKKQEPQILYSKDLLSDSLEAISNHYVFLGESNFDGPLVNISGIKSKCIENGATLVLYSITYINTTTGQSYYYVPNNSTSTESGSIKSPYGGKYKYDSTTTTNESIVVPYSYNIERYNQHAVYFAKSNKPILLGIAFIDLTNDQRKLLTRNTGVSVQVVYKDTPAFNANILIGDIIIEINGVQILNRNMLTNYINQSKSGDAMNITLIRNGKLLIIPLTI